MNRNLANIIADSVSPAGKRLTTMEIQIPRIVLAEFNTHRLFSRNSASSRAIPIEKMLKLVMEDPYIPERWGKNGKGMQDHGEFSQEEQRAAEVVWLSAREAAVNHVKILLEHGVHKQTTNRLLEPFMWHTVIVTATEWDNFFSQRCHDAAHPAIRRTAEAMRDAMTESVPKQLGYFGWHLPYIQPEDEDLLLQVRKEVCVARCARVSYLSHDGKREVQKDLDLYNKLRANGHLSPFEHVAMPVGPSGMLPWYASNLRGWVQYRKHVPNEENFLFVEGGQ